MKYYILPIFLIIGLTNAKAQLTPDSEAKKNYQILATRFSTTTSFEGLADAEHRLLVAIKNDADNQATWLLPFNGVQYNSGVIPQCIEENTHSNIATNEVIKPGSEVKIGVLRGTEKFDIEAQYWEHDGGNSCSFEREAGDAGWSRGRQLYGPGSTSSVWVQRKFDLNNYANNNEKSGASIKIQKAFRYHYGDSLQRPLDFGLIALGQTKSHTNSTKELGHWTDNGLDIAPDPTLSYQNRYGTSGIDVFYQFQVPSKGAKVSISASSLQAALTGFNLGLFNAQGTRLRFVSSSSIDMNLCPGIYTVLVEGVNNQRGKFQISIAATTLAAGNAGSLSAVDTRVCPGSALPYITGTSATLGGDFDPTNINYE
ncbi:MAG: hypothetical protein KDC53_21920, partial [Saprospiraceae bacterium]|nr:hypothetical protein [Saprospiraceae bacterium]